MSLVKGPLTPGQEGEQGSKLDFGFRISEFFITHPACGNAQVLRAGGPRAVGVPFLTLFEPRIFNWITILRANNV